ncbi:hypothetical protein Tco_1246752 [Tanacetum coccineum]
MRLKSQKQGSTTDVTSSYPTILLSKINLCSRCRKGLDNSTNQHSYALLLYIVLDSSWALGFRCSENKRKQDTTFGNSADVNNRVEYKDNYSLVAAFNSMENDPIEVANENQQQHGSSSHGSSQRINPTAKGTGTDRRSNSCNSQVNNTGFTFFSFRESYDYRNVNHKLWSF